jgi:hypothetical protein
MFLPPSLHRTTRPGAGIITRGQPQIRRLSESDTAWVRPLAWELPTATERPYLLRDNSLWLGLEDAVRLKGRLAISTGIMLGSLLIGCGAPAKQSNTTSPPPSSSTTLPVKVTTEATPSGWLPVSYGDAQLSVPSSWALVTNGAGECGPNTGVIVLGSGEWCPASMNVTAQPNTSVLTLKVVTPSSVSAEGPPITINGISVYQPGVAAVYVVPSLHVELTFDGPPQPEVLQTLTFSPRSVALAPGHVEPVPKSWRSVSFAGVSLSVPGSWQVRRTPNAPPCATDIVLPEGGVTLAAGPASPISCPVPKALIQPVPQVAGVEVDDFSDFSSQASCVDPRTINGLDVCVGASPIYAVMVVRVRSVGDRTVKIGMFGDGEVGRTILHSMRPSVR